MSTHDWPDPEKVRRALIKEYYRSAEEHDAVENAARAYLRMQEEQQELTCFECGGKVTAMKGALGTIYSHDCPVAQPPAEPGLTIEQVIAACGDGAARAMYLAVQYGPPPLGGGTQHGWRAFSESGSPGEVVWGPISDTPEAAIQQLGRDAIAKIKERHAADAAKLKELGVEP